MILDQYHLAQMTTPISKADIEAQFTAVEFDKAMEELRAKRNRSISRNSDHYALSDQTLSDDARTYRQALETSNKRINDSRTRRMQSHGQLNRRA